ncbi:MAG: alpha/beta hydrolase [Candidatus Limnocylindrales bacterium]|nr:alpha/beta hydrolase [Candidatus Limnocylindrales bacterium]
MTATTSDLPAAVASVLESLTSDPGTRSTTVAAGIPFSSIRWGKPGARPLLLIHGVTASARIWWRLGPALAATGRRVIAVDLPGHGLTGTWRRHHRFRDNATDVAAWIREAGLATADLQIVGHSWGAMTAAALPRAGIRPATLVLLDPPAVPYSLISEMANDPSERPYREMAEAIARLSAANPAWSAGDVEAKAEALVQLDVEAARAVLLDNGDWDGGLTDLADAAAARVPTWIVRGDPAAGGLLPDARLPAFEALLGADHVITLRGAPHAPQRTHPAETTQALLHALAS